MADKKNKWNSVATTTTAAELVPAVFNRFNPPSVSVSDGSLVNPHWGGGGGGGGGGAATKEVSSDCNAF